MVDNEKLFTITLNLSEVTTNTGKKSLVMLLDETKMTLVYEVMEWIRWIFSIENCFHLTHNDSVIHSAEKIKILALLKTVDVQPCTVKYGHCFFSKLDSTIFSKLNFFQEWMNVRVPTFFVESLNAVSSKLSVTNEKNTCVRKNEFNTDINIGLGNKIQGNFNIKANRSFQLNQALNKEIPTKTISPLKISSCPQKQKNDAKASNSKSSKVNSEVIAEEELCENEAGKINRIRKHANLERSNCCSQGNDMGSSYVRNHCQESEELNLKSDNVEEKINNAKEETVRTRKFKSIYCGKPFSLGETLNSLRNSLESTSEFFSKQDSAVSGSYSAPPVAESAWGKNMSSMEPLLDLEGNVKKRKRIRRSRSKKKNYEELNKSVVPYEKMMWNNDNTIKEIKSKHIRFNSSGDESNSDVNEKPNKIFNEEDKNSAECFEVLGENFEPENANVSTNDKSQNSFSLGQSNKCEENVQNLNENAMNVENQFAMEAAEMYSPRANESNAKSAEFNTLLSLKNLFRSPVVIDRF